MTYINHFNSQFAGEVGLVSVGLGKEFRRYSIGGMYGFVPSSMSGGPLIETVTLRQTYSFYDWERVRFYGGLNIFHVLGVRYETQDYGDAPTDYYPIGSIRALLNLGTSLSLDNQRTRKIYFEIGLNDLSIVNYINNSQSLDLDDEFSLALGFIQMF